MQLTNFRNNVFTAFYIFGSKSADDVYHQFDLENQLQIYFEKN